MYNMRASFLTHQATFIAGIPNYTNIASMVQISMAFGH